MVRHLVPLALALGCARTVSAQVFLDRGTLTLLRGGAETGRVEYAVRATAGQQGRPGLIVVGTTRTPAHEIQYILEVTAELSPLSYQSTESVGGRIVRRFSSQVQGPRFTARATTEAGDIARELPVRQPFVILGQDDFTVFYFVPRPDAGVSRTVNVVRTESLTPTTATVTGEGDDTVSVAGHPVPSRRFVLRLADGETRQFWMTPAGSLLQVSLPASSIIATRSQAPER